MSRLKELLEKYCERFEKELEAHFKKIDKTEIISPGDLEIADTLWHSIKAIKTVYAMLEASEENEYSGGYSGRMYRYSGAGQGARYSGENYSGANRGGSSGRMYDDYSGRRDNRGRYSRDSEKEDALMHLEGMIGRARSEEEARAIRDAINALQDR